MKSLRGTVLFLIDNEQLLLFKHLALYTCKKNSKERPILIAKLSGCFVLRCLSHIRLIDRLLRISPRCMGQLDANRYVFYVKKRLWLLDIVAKTVRPFHNVRPGFSVLNFCESDGCLFWGDYGTNYNREEINIYRLDGKLSVQVVYTFPKGQIRHIHNIVKNENGYIIMAGDNEQNAGFYKADADWIEILPWKTGKLHYRAVMGFAHKRGFLYATDSVEFENYIRIISSDGTETVLSSISGSCIYGTETKDYYIFSTTVEPHENGTIWSDKLGSGIKSRNVDCIAVSKETLETRIVKTVKKDRWPMKLFQYGTLQFPKGQTQNKCLRYNIIACKGDGKSEQIDL